MQVRETDALMRQSEWPLVCVIILNLNGKTHLEYSLPSFADSDYPHCEWILLDNGSTDGSVKYACDHFPSITVIQNEINLGWAAGNNVGIQYALEHGAHYIVLQNNDTMVHPQWLSAAVQVCEANPRIGIVGFTMLQEYVQGEDPDGERFRALSESWREAAYERAEHVTGAALFVRTSVFRDIGLIDEGYFAYGEEDDFERRARRAGYEMVRLNVPLWHYNGGFWRKHFLKSSVLAMRNNIRCMLKNDSPASIWRQLNWMVRFVCRPGITFDTRIPHFRRLRPSNFVVNTAILMYAFVWNLIHLPATLETRREDARRIAQARRRWDSVA